MTKSNEPTFRKSADAFADAIHSGRLTDCPADNNFAANYMYMGTYKREFEGKRDQFKNIETRNYL